MRIPIDLGTLGQVTVGAREEPGRDAGREENVEEVVEAECRDDFMGVEREGAEGEEGGDRLCCAEEDGWRVEERVVHFYVDEEIDGGDQFSL